MPLTLLRPLVVEYDPTTKATSAISILTAKNHVKSLYAPILAAFANKRG
jgi:hypothetical protein